MLFLKFFIIEKIDFEKRCHNLRLNEYTYSVRDFIDLVSAWSQAFTEGLFYFSFAPNFVIIFFNVIKKFSGINFLFENIQCLIYIFSKKIVLVWDYVYLKQNDTQNIYCMTCQSLLCKNTGTISSHLGMQHEIFDQKKEI